MVEALAGHSIIAGVPFSRIGQGLDDVLLVAATETTSEDDIKAFARELRKELALRGAEEGALN